MTKTHLVGISGSLRRGSYNTALLRAAFEALPGGVTADIAPLSSIPMFDDDLPYPGGVPSVAELRERVATADGIVFATPEYNWSVTGALKNAIDWLSLGPDSPLDFKPAAIVGAGGGSGTARSQQHLRDILSHNRLCIVADPQVKIPNAAQHFEAGELADEAVRGDLRVMIDRLVELIERSRTGERLDPHGSVLIVASSDDAMDTMMRAVAEMGHRSLRAFAAEDAARILTRRAVAVVMVETVIGREGLRRLEDAAGGVPIVSVGHPSKAASVVEEALRYADGGG